MVFGLRNKKLMAINEEANKEDDSEEDEKDKAVSENEKEILDSEDDDGNNLNSSAKIEKF